MRDIPQDTLSQTTKTEQSARIDLWEIDLTAIGGQRYYFSNELNEKGDPVTWQGRKYDAYPIQGTGFELSGKGHLHDQRWRCRTCLVWSRDLRKMCRAWSGAQWSGVWCMPVFLMR